MSLVARTAKNQSFRESVSDLFDNYMMRNGPNDQRLIGELCPSDQQAAIVRNGTIAAVTCFRNALRVLAVLSVMSVHQRMALASSD